MATDCDAPRTRPEDEPAEESLEQLRAGSASHKEATLVEDEANLHEAWSFPGADLSGQELTVRILPCQRDEFTCTRCFLAAGAAHHVDAVDMRAVARSLMGTGTPWRSKENRARSWPCAKLSALRGVAAYG